MFQDLSLMKQAASYGASWLDKIYPEWYKHIQMRKLDLRDCSACIAGQLFSYGARDERHKGFVVLYDFLTKHPDGSAFIQKCGFAAGNDEKYRQLTAAWLTEINYRRGFTNEIDVSSHAKANT